MRVFFADVTDPDGLKAAFDSIVRARVGAVFVVADRMLWDNRAGIAELALRRRLPLMGE